MRSVNPTEVCRRPIRERPFRIPNGGRTCYQLLHIICKPRSISPDTLDIALVASERPWLLTRIRPLRRLRTPGEPRKLPAGRQPL
jgi:hypothetical protein